jgi:hypothetical protein
MGFLVWMASGREDAKKTPATWREAAGVFLSQGSTGDQRRSGNPQPSRAPQGQAQQQVGKSSVHDWLKV